MTERANGPSRSAGIAIRNCPSRLVGGGGSARFMVASGIRIPRRSSNVSRNRGKRIEKHDVAVGSNKGSAPNREGFTEKAGLLFVDNAPRGREFPQSSEAKRLGGARARRARCPGDCRGRLL